MSFQSAKPGVGNLRPADQMRPARTYYMVRHNFFLPKLEHNTATKRNSMISTMDNGLLLHMTQSISRSTTRSDCTKQTNH